MRLMNERARIIEILSEGKISAEEAAILLRELGVPPVDSSGKRKSKPRFLRVIAEKPGQPNGTGTQMRIPFPLLRTVAKLAKMFPMLKLEQNSFSPYCETEVTREGFSGKAI